MKKFIVTETKPVTAIWTYEVEANSEKEALEKVLNGEVLPTDKELDEPADFDVDSNFDVYEEGNG
jgi:hypothetical protein